MDELKYSIQLYGNADQIWSNVVQSWSSFSIVLKHELDVLEVDKQCNNNV